MRRFLTLLVLSLLATGCASRHYRTTQKGELKGKLLVQWVSYDEFVFRPDAEEPLTFTRSNGDTIVPEDMYTDGGSVPRPLWVLKSYSPWGYAPAFIVHDWLFEMKHCDYPGNEKYDHKSAAQVMSEVIKTLMEDPEYGGRNYLVLYSMHKAVASKVAEQLWEEGECDVPNLERVKRQAERPLFEYTIEFD